MGGLIIGILLYMMNVLFSTPFQVTEVSIADFEYLFKLSRVRVAVLRIPTAACCAYTLNSLHIRLSTRGSLNKYSFMEEIDQEQEKQNPCSTKENGDWNIATIVRYLRILATISFSHFRGKYQFLLSL